MFIVYTILVAALAYLAFVVFRAVWRSSRPSMTLANPVVFVRDVRGAIASSGCPAPSELPKNVKKVDWNGRTILTCSEPSNKAAPPAPSTDVPLERETPAPLSYDALIPALMMAAVLVDRDEPAHADDCGSSSSYDSGSSSSYDSGSSSCDCGGSSGGGCE